MPIYEYQCSHCHHQFELMQKISEPPVQQCPNCQQNTAERLVSAAGFQLKGSGWYVTDFRDKGKASAGQTKATSESATSEKSTPATESQTKTEKPKESKD